jgi:hypothetical protein
MRKPETTTILVTLFTILTLISLLTVYSTHQASAEETITNTLCGYGNIADYDYTAILEHNLINNNITILGPGEGTLYTKILRQINITLTYRFYATLPAQTTITYYMTETLQTTAFSYQISETTPTTTNQTLIHITIPPVLKTELDPIMTTLAQETGTTAPSYYSLDITPTFTVSANTTVGQIHQFFAPTLTVEFARTDQGDVTTVETLRQTSTGAITEEETIANPDTSGQRYASYVLITISVAGLFFSGYFYQKTKPPKTEKPTLDKLISPYKDLIIEATEPPKTTPETTIINVESIKELAKTAEILARPIILTRKPQPTLTIVDQNTIYQHKP